MSRIHVVMYHYVQDPLQSRFPKLKGMRQDDFVRQVDDLRSRFEMVSLDQAMAFWRGELELERDGCLLTFDDGLREHAEFVTPVLSERGISGLFFLISACAGGEWMASVHQNHALMAELEFADYALKIKSKWRETTETDWPEPSPADPVGQTYRWDDIDTARFKYSLNFLLPSLQKEEVVDATFSDVFGSTGSLAREWYSSWDELIEMQGAGQVLGGHTHKHHALTTLTPAQLQHDLEKNLSKLLLNLMPQRAWPFCYPYGKRVLVPDAAPGILKSLGFCCAFSTEVGISEHGEDPFMVRRLDCKDV